MLKLLESLQTLQEGDLKGLEQQVRETVFALGRSWMEQILSRPAAGQDEAASQPQVGSCGHPQRLVGQRPKQVLTLLGKIMFQRAYYHCVLPEERPASQGNAAGQSEAAACPPSACTQGHAPADGLWGVQGRRSSAGVQQVVSYLCASMTLEEVAEAFSRLVPLDMSARQALNLMQPVGEVLLQEQEEQVAALWEQAAQARTEPTAAEQAKQEEIERLYIELDGITARLRRGSVPMEEKELRGRGDVYREVKVGAVFSASQGPHRSGLAPGVFVDQAGEKRYVARRSKAEDFGRLLYALALSCGLLQACQLVVLGDGAHWIWRLAAEHFPHAVQIVDLWHAREHVWKVARAAFGSGTAQTASPLRLVLRTQALFSFL